MNEKPLCRQLFLGFSYQPPYVDAPKCSTYAVRGSVVGEWFSLPAWMIVMRP